MALNVFNQFPHAKKWYLLHPWHWFSDAWYNAKCAWQRATRGYCDMDWFNMDTWMLEILPPMLRKMANGSAYPGHEPFDTPEKWENWLKSMADVLESVQEENWDGQNEYYHDWIASSEHRWNFTSTWTTTYTDEDRERIKEKYFVREQELRTQRLALIEDCFKQLAQNIDSLWD